LPLTTADIGRIFYYRDAISEKLNFFSYLYGKFASMDNCSKKHIPEMGRGFVTCDCGDELRVEPVEGCYKLHETPWLEEYPDNVPTDIFEVRFKNTRRL